MLENNLALYIRDLFQFKKQSFPAFHFYTNAIAIDDKVTEKSLLTIDRAVKA